MFILESLQDQTYIMRAEPGWDLPELENFFTSPVNIGANQIDLINSINLLLKLQHHSYLYLSSITLSMMCVSTHVAKTESSNHRLTRRIVP